MPGDAGVLLKGFITGGLVVAGTTLLASRMGSKAAGLFWAFPALALTTIFFLWCLPDGNPEEFACSLVVSYLLLFLFSAGMCILLRRGLPLWTAVMGALVGWVVLTCLLHPLF